MKLTEKIWDDFVDRAVDASGAAGWKWFKNEYGFTPESLKKQILENEEKAEKWKSLEGHGLRATEFADSIWDDYKKLEQENKQLREETNNLKFRLADEQDEINRIKGEWRNDAEDVLHIKRDGV